ncbi:hypothetical protein [Priestia taiwanensis]|uniref:Secreted protein n=1 Tax=Priestia taiwanensis TaxID=1347902 RepID=A0A917AQ37_9BACI|nr:hypothetical protein [Priestia taiwanensis]MBM7362719.1 hypothetical protein [Priestia taiwanensis]GGE64534.1 hypothetical protein GCM10007140_13420 [Priestia taiwanensis]
MKKAGFLAAVIVLGSLTGVAQASPVVENINQSTTNNVQSIEVLPIILPLFVGSSTFIEGNHLTPLTGDGTVYDITPTKNGFYIKGLAFGTGYIKVDGVKMMIDVSYHHSGPNSLK